MVSVARRNLFNDKTRLTMGLGGILFAVILMIFAVGMMYGTLRYAVDLVDHGGADIWVLSSKSKDVLSPATFDDSLVTKVREIPGVERASNLIINSNFSASVRGGESKAVYLVGFDPATGLGGPWALKEGDVTKLNSDMTAIIDRAGLQKLGHIEIGQKIDMADQQLEIVGFTEGQTWMLGMPYIYTSLSNFQKLLHWEGQTFAVLVKTAPGSDVKDAVTRISAVPGLQAFTKQEMHDKYIEGWLAGTPAGYMSGAMVGIGFLVGLMMVGITLYTATIERIREFGILRAIGASNMDIYKIIFEQAFVCAIVGYILGAAGGLVLGRLYESAAGMAFLMPPLPLLAGFGMVLIMSGAGAFFAIRKAAKVDPALVFKS